MMFRSLLKSKLNTFDMMVNLISSSDLLLGFYLIIILVANLYYNKVFFIHEDGWRGSIVCHLASLLFHMFELISPMLLSFTTLTRYLVVIYPFNYNYKSAKWVFKGTSVIVMISLLLSITSWLVYYVIEGNKLHGIPLCILIGDSSESTTVKMLTLLQSIYQILACMFIITVYCLLIAETKRLKAKVKQKLSNALIFQIVSLSVSNILCWLPSAVIFIFTFFIRTFPVKMLTWTIIAVVPVNSLINPIIFQILAIKGYLKERTKINNKKERASMSIGMKPNDKQNWRWFNFHNGFE